jgi:hypothetical protein
MVGFSRPSSSGSAASVLATHIARGVTGAN